MANKLGTKDTDTIVGTAADDLIKGLGGDDFLRGGDGADILNGGTGVDFALYHDSAEGVIVDLRTGRGYGGTAEGDTLFNIENLEGSNHADTLIGNDGRNFMVGEDGGDLLLGLDGDDILWGEYQAGSNDADDTLKGGGGTDTLVGMSGDDHLDGGAGRDFLVGNGLGNGGFSGTDTFVWWSAEDTGTTELTADVIMDFDYTEGDGIDLQGIDADVYAAGNQSFTFIGSAAFSGTPGEIRYYHSDGHTCIEMQTGTAADVEGVIALTYIHTPEASWFML